MELTIEQALKQGVAAHKEGKLEDAERLYRAILPSQPAHPDANHNLGVIAVSVNKADAALPLFKTALEANPKIEQFWLSYIDALIKERQFDNARQILEQAKKQGVSTDKVDALESHLKHITHSALPKSPEKKKSLTLKEKRKKIAASKQQKKQAKGKNANSLSPSKSQEDNLLAHYQNGRYDEAEQLALRITQEFPSHQFGWKALGAALQQTGRIIESLTAMQQSVQLAPQDAEANTNLGVTLQELGRLGDAEASYKQAIALKPDYTEAHYNLGVTLRKMGRLDDAEASYAQAITLKPDYAEAHTNLGVTLQELGRLDEAEASYAQAIRLKPDYTEAHYNLGITLQELGRLEETEASYAQAIRLKPDYAEAHSNLGVTLQKLGRLDDAEASYAQAIRLKPDYAEAHSNLGVTLQKLGRLDDAEASYAQAIVLKPDNAESHSNLGVTLQELGRLDDAEASYAQAITLKPDYAEAYSNLGATLQKLGRLDGAEASYAQAITLKPDYAEAHSNLGVTLQKLGRLDDAEASYAQAIALKPDNAEAHSNLGVTLQELGRLDEAEASYAQAIRLKPDYAEAHRNLTVIKKFDAQDEQYSKMQALYLNENISEEQLCHISFGLAKACEDLGDFEQAYTHYGEANALRKKLLNYDINQDVELFRKLKSSYPRIVENALEPDKLSKNPIPVFIVGMPRSGTTLVEQIISSHSKVTGAGELSFATQFGAAIANGLAEANNESLLNFRGKYLKKLQNFSNGNLIVTDKMPQNFLFIGLLAAAFPEAKIVNVKRNPAAVCWGNYKQYFRSKSISYCYGLDDVVAYYSLYQNLMEFWEMKLPNRIYNLDYERLTTDQDDETKKLIQHLDLDWDNKCLSPQNNRRSVATASNTQVRQEVYQGSSKQWKRYEPFLNGAFDGLLL
jgi:tetratricopeptide (TPR) repeat protein